MSTDTAVRGEVFALVREVETDNILGVLELNGKLDPGDPKRRFSRVEIPTYSPGSVRVPVALFVETREGWDLAFVHPSGEIRCVTRYLKAATSVDRLIEIGWRKVDPQAAMNFVHGATETARIA